MYDYLNTYFALLSQHNVIKTGILEYTKACTKHDEAYESQKR